jgi:DNA (cytosine-5)-methyltransferase 1
MTAYYNEIDPEKAAWLRELIKAGLIAPGDVDERSIKDVKAAELMGYTQCHFFAGIGVWSYALRLAGWPDDRPVWTGSCPCPGFSCAGKGGGFDDPRHLWPDWYPLIRECRPGTVFGEQADDAVGFGWLDLVCGEMEAAGYAIAPAVLGAHSAGAPHIRQRLYFCAHAEHAERRPEHQEHGNAYGRDGLGRGGNAGGGSNTECSERRAITSGGANLAKRSDGGRREEASGFTDDGQACQCADTDGGQSCDGDVQRSGEQRLLAADRGIGDMRHAQRYECGQERADGRGRGERSHPQELEQRPLHDGAGVGEHTSSVFSEQSAGERTRPHETQRGGPCRESTGPGDTLRPWRGPGWLDPLTARSVAEAGATRGFWADCDWWYGRDGKYRPIGPGLQPLASGVAARMVRLRGYGDSIIAPLAAEFIKASIEAIGDVGG